MADPGGVYVPLTPPPLEQAVERVRVALREEVALLTLSPAIVDGLARRAVAAAFIFEPDNHHNAALCPYCTPSAKAGESRG